MSLPKSTESLVVNVSRELRLNAAAFIVTIYGDMVVPRGGVLWTGTLIDLCNEVGINESLVRTAVSRLVEASQLQGERIGRRSFYRLRASAATEFQRAADLLYGPDKPATGWQILHLPALKVEDARRQRLGHIGGSVFIRPDRGQSVPEGILAFHAEMVSSSYPLEKLWDLSVLHQGYEQFTRLFEPVETAVLTGSEPLILRLLLVHAYRLVLLRDPCLPVGHLPDGWKGAEARRLFRRLYQALTPAAHGYISGHCEGVDGPLPAETDVTVRRRSDLNSAL